MIFKNQGQELANFFYVMIAEKHVQMIDLD